MERDSGYCVHAVEGGVDGAGLVFRSKTNSADYHDEMNSDTT